MKQIEEMLKDYWYLKRDAKRLMLDLSMAQHAYEHCMHELPSSCRYSVIKSKNRRIAKPVEINVIIMIDEYRAQVESIEKRLEKTRTAMARIDDILYKAELDARQGEYIRLRYFENMSAEAVSRKMFCSEATCRRIRRDTLEKVSNVLKEPDT